MNKLLGILLVMCSLSAMGQTAKGLAAKLQGLTLDSDAMWSGPYVLPPIYAKYQEEKAAIKPECFLDSVRMDFSILSYLDPHEIGNIILTKDKKKYPDGAFFLTLKDHNFFLKLCQSKILSLSDIFNTYATKKEKHKPIIFLLDEKLLTDTTAIRIPDMALFQVTIAQASEVPYFKTALPNVLLMKVTTKWLSTKPYRPKIVFK
jgi:hypothetical protein